ncbi:MAG: hypothetical protein KUG48_01865 [Oleibacter sp.]|jgi:hypothetical protein|nr:hypothetical protein [Thalassolituus sp.]
MTTFPLFSRTEDAELRVIVLLSVMLLSACNYWNSSYGKMPDKELRERNYRCQMAGSLSAAEIQVCKNIRRECDVRADNGIYVC